MQTQFKREVVQDLEIHGLYNLNQIFWKLLTPAQVCRPIYCDQESHGRIRRIMMHRQKNWPECFMKYADDMLAEIAEAGPAYDTL